MSSMDEFLDAIQKQQEQNGPRGPGDVPKELLQLQKEIQDEVRRLQEVYTRIGVGVSVAVNLPGRITVRVMGKVCTIDVELYRVDHGLGGVQLHYNPGSGQGQEWGEPVTFFTEVEGKPAFDAKLQQAIQEALES
ncbi:hypothetical protein [Dyella subtropica]|uniref:hypothetical protein n=1 Tax=Dyella subtropica TaxID=2992127 RepID=UPI0022583DD6|nr:hypothetical protein [Dyella subtropica]